MSEYTNELLKELRALPLEEKIELSKDRIEDWYMQFYGNVYVSFSGGKDSTVLLHLVRSMFPEVPAVFCDTGLEYPELKKFAKGKSNVRTLYPRMTFKDVITDYGYPLVSKETAEAIYYARRHTAPKAERERERERERVKKTHTYDKTCLRKRQELLGQREYGSTGEEPASPG